MARGFNLQVHRMTYANGDLLAPIELSMEINSVFVFVTHCKSDLGIRGLGSLGGQDRRPNFSTSRYTPHADIQPVQVGRVGVAVSLH